MASLVRFGLVLLVGLPLASPSFLCTSMHVSSRLLSWLLPGRINPKIDFFYNEGGDLLDLDKNDIFL